jgi:RNA polymerase sigma factor (TIGR02999 family)
VADITLLLDAIQRGEPDAADALLTQVYAELRALARAKMAREPSGHTLQPTALVHEAWLRLGEQRFENRAHFFGAAAEAMWRILIERARRNLAARNGNLSGTSRNPKLSSRRRSPPGTAMRIPSARHAPASPAVPITS